ncbi:MAG: hypothetical protein C0432_03190 [Candidatus Puniceispirillum sp.]|nr:hypothetical protein [Candidatus Pelagibacter sp.]MBA4283279.1 hypothetical protein [Candidatus Puniceispirillum sp.]
MIIQFVRRSSFLFFVLSMFAHAFIFGAALLLPQIFQNTKIKSLPLGNITTFNVSFLTSQNLGSLVQKKQMGYPKTMTRELKKQGLALSKKQTIPHKESAIASHRQHLPVEPEKIMVVDISSLSASQSNQQPPYPEEAEKNGIEAKCLVKILIDRNGHIQKIRPLSSSTECSPIFMQEIQNSLKHWKFNNPQSSNIETVVPIDFKLSDYY